MSMHDVLMATQKALKEELKKIKSNDNYEFIDLSSPKKKAKSSDSDSKVPWAVTLASEFAEEDEQPDNEKIFRASLELTPRRKRVSVTSDDLRLKRNISSPQQEKGKHVKDKEKLPKETQKLESTFVDFMNQAAADAAAYDEMRNQAALREKEEEKNRKERIKKAKQQIVIDEKPKTEITTVAELQPRLKAVAKKLDNHRKRNKVMSKIIAEDGFLDDVSAILDSDEEGDGKTDYEKFVEKSEAFRIVFEQELPATFAALTKVFKAARKYENKTRKFSDYKSSSQEMLKSFETHLDLSELEEAIAKEKEHILRRGSLATLEYYGLCSLPWTAWLIVNKLSAEKQLVKGQLYFLYFELIPAVRGPENLMSDDAINPYDTIEGSVNDYIGFHIYKTMLDPVLDKKKFTDIFLVEYESSLSVAFETINDSKGSSKEKSDKCNLYYLHTDAKKIKRGIESLDVKLFGPLNSNAKFSELPASISEDHWREFIKIVFHRLPDSNDSVEVNVKGYLWWILWSAKLERIV